MGSGKHHIAGVAQLFRDLWAQRTQPGAGHHGLAEYALGDTRLSQYLPIPVPSHGVQHTGGGSVGVFIGLHTGEQIVQVVGHH